MAAPLLAGELEPARERALADPVDPRDLGLAALAGLVGRERPLAQVGGVGTRHRSPPVGVKTIPTADRGAGSVDGRAIRSRRSVNVVCGAPCGLADHDKDQGPRRYEQALLLCVIIVVRLVLTPTASVGSR